MKAMILAAGRGERLRPLTDHTPKPLIAVNGIPLIEYHIIKLADAGITEIVVNLSWLGEKIEHYLQDGKRWGVNIRYSWERPSALETAGGIIKALPLLVDPKAKNSSQEVFLVINGDIYFDYNIGTLPQLTEKDLAHLWLVANPEHNLKGDFNLLGNRVSVIASQDPNIKESQSHEFSCTFSGVGLYKAAFFYQLTKDIINGPEDHMIKLGPSLKMFAQQGMISGEMLPGYWTDVGTQERLQQANTYIGANG